MTRLPSIKSLVKNNLACTPEGARAIRAALDTGDNDRANTIMGAYGIECIAWPKGCFNNCQTPAHTLEYFNVGETYAATLLSIDNGPWFVGSWGDSLEWMERAYGRQD